MSGPRYIGVWSLLGWTHGYHQLQVWAGAALCDSVDCAGSWDGYLSDDVLVRFAQMTLEIDLAFVAQCTVLARCKRMKHSSSNGGGRNMAMIGRRQSGPSEHDCNSEQRQRERWWLRWLGSR